MTNRIEKIRNHLSERVYEGNVYTNIADDIHHLLSKLEIAEKALEQIERADDSSLIEHPHGMVGIAAEALKAIREG